MNAHTIATSVVDDHATVVSPLIGNGNVELLDDITVADLRAVYLDLFDVDVYNKLLGSDTVKLYRCRNSGLRFLHPAIAGSESFYEALQRRLTVTEPVEAHCREYEQHFDVVCAFQVLEHDSTPLRRSVLVTMPRTEGIDLLVRPVS
jgi:hypothetical protein